jgi:DNA invertase Pin-like site-specific DNA recombinase
LRKTKQCYIDENKFSGYEGENLREREIGFKVLSASGSLIDTKAPNERLCFGIFAAVAELERKLIAEHSRAGFAAARPRGRNGGRTRKMTKTAL